MKSNKTVAKSLYMQFKSVGIAHTVFKFSYKGSNYTVSVSGHANNWITSIFESGKLIAKSDSLNSPLATLWAQPYFKSASHTTQRELEQYDMKEYLNSSLFDRDQVSTQIDAASKKPNFNWPICFVNRFIESFKPSIKH